MEFFVTGATGFVGGHLADRLLDDGHDLVVLARTPSDAAHLADRGATVVEGDLTERDSLRAPMRGVDGVFHLAAWYDVGPADVTTAEAVNVEGTRNVLEVMADLEIPRGVYTSTLAVNSDTDGRVVDESYRFDGTHLTVYDRTKWEAHYEVAQPMIETGLPLVTVLPGVVYGPGDRSVFGRALRDYLDGDLPVIPRETGYTFGHVEDIADAHGRAMTAGTPGEEYIVGGPRATLVEAFDVIAEAAGRAPPRSISPRVFRALAPIASGLERVMSLPAAYRAETLRVLGGATYYGDNEKARSELGIEHRSLAAGLAATVEAELEGRATAPA